MMVASDPDFRFQTALKLEIHLSASLMNNVHSVAKPIKKNTYRDTVSIGVF